jgi:hypothetical protein
VLALNNPAPQEFVAVNDSFGESGTPAQLMEKYKLNNQAIVAAVERVIKENNLLICTDRIFIKTHLVLKQDGFYLTLGHCTNDCIVLFKNLETRMISRFVIIFNYLVISLDNFCQDELLFFLPSYNLMFLKLLCKQVYLVSRLY